MALDHGPKIVTSGLVFSIDAADSNSYRSGSAFVYNTANLERSGSVSGSMAYNSQGRGAFAFSGNGAAILFPEDSSLNTQTPTVEVWIKTNNTNQSGFWFEKGQVNTQYSLFQESTNIVWRQASLSQYTATSTYINTTDWAQVVGTFVSGDRRTYINGIVRTSDTQTGTISTNSNGMSVGLFGGFNGSRGYSYNGNIGAIRVYNRVLSPQEILQNYNEQLNRFRQ